ncbi:hypothetical protein [Streptomyces sp. NPDC057301]|uniref:hypothetical protein n=1 Tax=Streptomyces sp. NPDC057301 TaxID=3346093 RepID=UPI00362A9943
MSGHTLTTASVLICPHGGQVRITAAAARVTIAGAAVATTADTFAVTGCPFQIPAVVPVPSPCVRVQWLVPDLTARAGGAATVSRGSAGVCLAATGVPQGPVGVVAVQPLVSTA